jgi:primary-amine oxidase
VKSDIRVKEALARRGITDLDRVLVDLWTGFFSDPKKRIANPLLFYKPTTHSNFYACPIDGIKVVVDMNKQVVLEVKELFEVPIPPDIPQGEVPFIFLILTYYSGEANDLIAKD